MHSGFAEVMDESSLLRPKMSAHHDQVAPDRSMGEELTYEGLSICLGLGKE